LARNPNMNQTPPHADFHAHRPIKMLKGTTAAASCSVAQHCL
jgi:hypothetical protein